MLRAMVAAFVGAMLVVGTVWTALAAVWIFVALTSSILTIGG